MDKEGRNKSSRVYSSLTFTPECEMRSESETNWKPTFDSCVKNPGHLDFISVKHFSYDRFFPSHSSEDPGKSVSESNDDQRLERERLDAMSYFQLLCDLTARVSVKYTSPHRPDFFPGTQSPYPYCIFRGSTRKRRYATASLDSSMYHQTGSCPCEQCVSSDSPKEEFWICLMRTATHAVCDRLEAGYAKFDFFLDSEDAEENGEAVTIHGLNVDLENFNCEDDRSYYNIDYYATTYSCRYTSDIILVVCITHDRVVADRLNHLMKRSDDLQSKGWNWSESQGEKHFIVSHPHGAPKMVSVGEIENESFISLREVFLNSNEYMKQTHSEMSGTYRVIGDTSDALFPIGALLTTPRPLCDSDLITDADDGVNLIKIPPRTNVEAYSGDETQFDLLKEMAVPLDSLAVSCWWFHHYTTPTCPGSSGALVVNPYSLEFSHSGTQLDKNKSGILCII